MRKTLPTRMLLTVTGSIAIVALLVGLLADLGAHGPWIVAAVSVGLAAGVLGAISHDRRTSRGSAEDGGDQTSANSARDVTVAEAVCVLLVGVAAFFVTKTVDLRADLNDTRAKLTAAETPKKPASFTFFVYAGEADPESDFSSATDSDTAYARAEPDVSAPTISKGFYNVGARVQVSCKLAAGPADLMWFRLRDGAFMNGAVVKPVPHSGEKSPPACP